MSALTRVQVLTVIAERYHELVHPSFTPNGFGDGTGVNLMPRTYTATVREFERLYTTLRADGKKPVSERTTRDSEWWWRCLRDFYLRAEPRTVFECPRCRRQTHAPEHVHTDGFGKDSTYQGRRIIVIHRPVQDSNRVGAGALKAVEWMAEHWSLASEPMLPTELVTYKKAA